MPLASRIATTAETYLLAAVGGCIDAVGVITLGGLFVSHMSGNTAALGAAFGQGDWSAGWPHLFAVPVFLFGLFLGYLWIGESIRRCAGVFLVEAILLAIFGVALWLTGGLPSNTSGYFLMAAPPLIAMGLQNATLRQIGRSSFPSTYVTGVLDRLAKGAALWFQYRGTPRAAAQREETLASLFVWFAYVAGAVGGGAGLLAHRPLVLIAPIATLLFLSVRLVREKP
jgi:uncharacterized membrane protein YoaK (UPF0700 family)